jgi:RHS repeat-associated protein
VIEYAYDAAGRRTATTLGGQTWQYGYDGESRLTSRTTPLGRTTTLTRDAAGSVVEISDPPGLVTSFTRDELQRVTEKVDPLGRTNSYAYDARGMLAAASNGVSGARYAYNELGLLKTLTDPNGEDWPFDCTDMGRLALTADPLARTNAYEYDALGRLAGMTFADGQTVVVGYDGVGSVTNRTYADGTEITCEYDALNRLIGTKGTTLALSLAYDAESRVTATENSGTAFGATFDRAGRLKTATYNNDAFAVTYAYNAAGLLTRVEDSLTGTILTFSYDADRRLVGIARPNGVNTAYRWDDAGRIVRIRDGSVLDLRYRLDAAGQVTRARVKAPLTAAVQLASAEQSHTFDAASQLSAAGHAYDARGRQTAKPGGTFTWNAAGHLTGVSNGSHRTYMTYSGMGDVMTRTRGAETTHFHYNYAIAMKPVVAEKDERGEFAYYVWTPAGRLLYMIDAADGNKVYHYHFDRAGSTLALTDAGGTVTDAYCYTPFGRLLAGTGRQPFTFAGQWGVRGDKDGAIHHMRARYYDAWTGRFLSRDPVWPVLRDITSINPYAYAGLNPVSRVDPSGTQWSACGAEEWWDSLTLEQKRMWVTIKRAQVEVWLRVGNREAVRKALQLVEFAQGEGIWEVDDAYRPYGPLTPAVTGFINDEMAGIAARLEAGDPTAVKDAAELVGFARGEELLPVGDEYQPYGPLTPAMETFLELQRNSIASRLEAGDPTAVKDAADLVEFARGEELWPVGEEYRPYGPLTPAMEKFVTSDSDGQSYRYVADAGDAVIWDPITSDEGRVNWGCDGHSYRYAADAGDADIWDPISSDYGKVYRGLDGKYYRSGEDAGDGTVVYEVDPAGGATPMEEVNQYGYFVLRPLK